MYLLFHPGGNVWMQLSLFVESKEMATICGTRQYL
jgi:hypothetical protein